MCLLGIVGHPGVSWGNKTDRAASTYTCTLYLRTFHISVGIKPSCLKLIYFSFLQTIVWQLRDEHINWPLVPGSINARDD